MARQNTHLEIVAGPVEHPRREFHIAAAARRKYDFPDALYGLSGNVIFADIQAARTFAAKVNRAKKPGEPVISTSDLNAMGLIDEILHYIVGLYRESYGQDVFGRALTHLRNTIGAGKVDEALRRFLEYFPPRDVHSGAQSVEDFLSSSIEGVPGRQVALEELLMLWIANRNPAFRPFAEFFDDVLLRDHTAYMPLMHSMGEFFRREPTFGPDDEHLVDLLRAPARAHPDSLHDQLAYIRSRWGSLIGTYLFRLLRSLDVIREEHRARFAGPGPTQVLHFGAGDEETERFSEDTDWMPKAVLMAKSTLVWLDQLSKTYGREIGRLDQIPDEELNALAAQGFTGLWLIGIWERSRASKRIKQMCGNPDAEASAYSLVDYQIAEELGGWEALTNLRDRCRVRGIRLASDMVPNHTGIDSRWIYEHPDWFVQLPNSPFPGYTFNGEDLSGRNGVGIRIEDHYYDRTDAAVVFKRSDSHGDRYIYHGNDGTSMPWNDTAQLNFLHPEAREAVIQTILHVARNFQIIRFDAAMTLAKRHYQRLWYPQPGSGGDIPSRAEHGMTKDDFDQAMPVEFWREVVDRVAEEVPDTLLLAEAFWMMEGYFVRTLGMHRVYNSAFMNMLKNEENGKYRDTIKNTIQFDKDILKRFVNFMNNPDEETAVAQFGKDGKYFGVCTLMVTMPGLPMFGHGQVEGFTEKYGMEYRRAYLNETADSHLVERHRREIFPLMKRRYLFAEVDNFFLYDFFSNGGVNENVFAYSNQAGAERALVIYNNSYERAFGWLRMSAGYVEKRPNGHKEHQQKSLAEALGLRSDERHYCILHEQRSDLWYIRSSRGLWSEGLFAQLDGYECQVFLDIYEVEDNEYSHYARLAERLGGSGVENIEVALREVFLEPLHAAFEAVLTKENLATIAQIVRSGSTMTDATLTELSEHYRNLADAASTFARRPVDASEVAADFEKRLGAVGKLPAAVRSLVATDGDSEELALWVLVSPLAALTEEPGSLVDEWLIDRYLHRRYPDGAYRFAAGGNWSGLLQIILGVSDLPENPDAAMNALLRTESAAHFLAFNTYNDVLWFSKEAFETLVPWLTIIAVADDIARGTAPTAAATTRQKAAKAIGDAAKKSEYRVETLLDLLAGKTTGQSAGGSTTGAGPRKAKSAGAKSPRAKSPEAKQPGKKSTK